MKWGFGILVVGIIIQIGVHFGFSSATREAQAMVEMGTYTEEDFVLVVSKMESLMMLKYLSNALIVIGLILGVFGLIKIKKEGNKIDENTPLDQI